MREVGLIAGSEMLQRWLILLQCSTSLMVSLSNHPQRFAFKTTPHLHKTVTRLQGTEMH
jgi:hypothetical protein